MNEQMSNRPEMMSGPRALAHDVCCGSDVPRTTRLAPSLSSLRGVPSLPQKVSDGDDHGPSH